MRPKLRIHIPMTGYTKLFGTIVASTIWREKNETRIVWITMLAMANKSGIVEASVPGLADMARVSLADCQEALKALSSPDEFSRTKDYDGRRIEEVDGGWAVLNHAKYRHKMSADERREYNAAIQRRYRAGKTHSVSTESANVSNRNGSSAMSAHAEADAKTESKRVKAKGTLEEVVAFCIELGLPKSDGEACFHKWEGNGWKNGQAQIKDWKSTIRSWMTSGYMPSQKNGTHPSKPDGLHGNCKMV